MEINNMQAIITKYIPATNTKPSRIKASCEQMEIAETFHNIEGDNDGERHRKVCDMLCARMDARVGTKRWSRPKASGQIPSGEYVFCFIPERVYRRAGK